MNSRPSSVRFQGRIVEWHDDRGFGFIMPNGGGDRVFLHIKSLASSRRPTGGELVNYRVVSDERGRLRADEAAYALQSRRPTSASHLNPVLLWLGAVALCAVVLAAVASAIPRAVAAVYLATSAATVLAYAFDKSAAQRGRWRTKETTLHALSLAGGWPGALVAQQLFRHKTRKENFRAAFWMTVVANLCGLFWLLSKPGAKVLSGLLPN